MTSIEQPKRAPPAYWLYLAANREEIEKNAPSKKGSDVAKKAGEMWKAASAEARKPFEEEAAKLKAEYDEKLKAFKEDGGVMTRKSPKSKKQTESGEKTKKDPNAPKKPVGGGYGQFMAESREEIAKSLPAGHKMTDVGKAAGEKWRALSEAEKEPYNARFAQKLEEYKKAKEEYLASLSQEPLAESPSPPVKATKKRATVEDSGEKKAPVAKRAKKSSNKPSAKHTGDEIDSEVLAEAEKLGFDSQLKNLVSRTEVAALSLPADKMLSALKDANGLVNVAKRALLAGA